MSRLARITILGLLAVVLCAAPSCTAEVFSNPGTEGIRTAEVFGNSSVAYVRTSVSGTTVKHHFLDKPRAAKTASGDCQCPELGYIRSGSIT